MVFISCQKLFSFLKYYNFCLDLLVIQENSFIKKLRVISKFMTLLTGHEIMTIHILSNISRSIDNQAMQFDQIIEYNVKNIFLQISCKNLGRKTSSGPLFFFKKKALQKIKARGHHLSLNIFQWITSWTENKKKFITFQAVDTRI